MSQHAAPGWYPDVERGWERWWDGLHWTAHRRPASHSNAFAPVDLVDTAVFPPVRGRVRATRRPMAAAVAAVMTAAVALVVLAVAVAVMAAGLEGDPGAEVATEATSTGASGDPASPRIQPFRLGGPDPTDPDVDCSSG